MSEKSINKMIILTTLGVSVLFVPTFAVRYGGVGGWIIIIGAGLLSCGYTAVILWIIKHIRGDNYGESRLKYGEVLNIVVSIWFTIKYIILAAVLIAVMGKIIKVELLGEVKYLWIAATLVLIGLYGGSKGDKGIVRISEFVFYIFLFPILMLMILSIKGTHTDELFTNHVDKINIWRIILGMAAVTTLFSPSEMLLFMPEIKNRINPRKIYIITGVITLINLIFFVLGVGKISAPVITAEGNATIKLMENVMIGNTVLNKHVGIYLSFFILLVMISISLLFAVTFILTGRIRMKPMKTDKNGCCRKLFCSIIVFLIVVGIAENNRSFSKALKETVARTDIEERRYVDGVFAQYKNSKYYILLTFAGEKNTPIYFKLYDMKDLEEEYKKQSAGQLDYSNMQAIVIDMGMLKNSDAMNDFFSFIDNEDTVVDNTYIFGTMTDITDIRKEYSEENDVGKTPGREMSEIIQKNKEYAGITLSDIKKLKYKDTKEEKISLFEFEEGIRLSAEAKVFMAPDR